MRIIGGKYRGKKLFSPDSDKVRPTSDRAREALFNILNSRLENSLSEYMLLDVFSGTGAFALEAVSRGIKKACLVDIDTNNLLKNTKLFPQEQSKIKVMRSDVSKLPLATEQYNLLFMDAPYKKGLTETALQKTAENKWLLPDSLCLVEVEKTEEITIPPYYQKEDERIYGLAKVLLLRYHPD